MTNSADSPTLVGQRLAREQRGGAGVVMPLEIIGNIIKRKTDSSQNAEIGKTTVDI